MVRPAPYHLFSITNVYIFLIKTKKSDNLSLFESMAQLYFTSFSNTS